MVVIIGAGILGLTIGRETLRRGGDVLIIEKEEDVGKHASGRNSGVLHAGIYYSPDSFKAKFCIEGNKLMKEYCKERGLPISEGGKVVVTRNEGEVDMLFELERKAKAAGVKAKIIDEKELKEIEPYARTYRKALWSPDTAVVDPLKILNSLSDEMKSLGGKFLFNTRFIKLKSSKSVLTTQGEIKFDFLVNCAGAFSDKVAHTFGVALNYKLVPFKGLYRKLRRKVVRSNIYPVPSSLFLGVHITRSVNGDVFAGPTAIPAFGRENYGIFDVDREAFTIFLRDATLLIKDPSFRLVAFTEPKKYLKKFFLRKVKALVPSLEGSELLGVSKVGIRAQLVDWNKKQLEMDFVLIRDGETVHILNAVSPAFTSSMSFAKYIVDMIEST